LFKPLLKRGHSIVTAQTVVFLFSAFFHEYVVSVPLQVVKVYAFTGMLMQVRSGSEVP
jgi:diacylglycerol O-acyltransferase-1